VKLKEKKKGFIISKEDIAYLQNYITETAVFVASKDADTVLLSLSINEIQKILEKIRKNEKKVLYLNKFKKPQFMKEIWNTYTYARRNDNSNEAIDIVITGSRLIAAKYFAERKKLPLKEFLKIFKINK
jgi:hypothetical protein